jgi:RNA polymerase sigma-B factor
MSCTVTEVSHSSEGSAEPAVGRQVPRTIPAAGITDADREQWWQTMSALPESDPERQRAREELIASHLPLVRYLAGRYRNRGENFDDLLQVGAVGLIKSIDRFDPDRGVAFSTFATPTILGEIRRHFRDKTWMIRVPRQLQELRGPIGNAREFLSHDLGRSPTIAEIATHIGVSEDQVLEALDASDAYSAVSIDAPISSDRSVGSFVDERLGSVDDAIDLIEMRECVSPLLDGLTERERRIVYLRFFREKTQTEIATELGLSQMHVSRLLSQILTRLRNTLADQLDAPIG